MNILITALVIVVVIALLGLAMSARIGELGSFLARETAAAGSIPATSPVTPPVPVAQANGKPTKPEPRMA